MKESYPLKLAEYAVTNKIIEEPAFSFWAKITLILCNRMINAVKYWYWSRTHKFGLELPHSWEEAIAVDRKMGTDYWWRAIEK